jgi:subtilisin family serine protease
MKKVISLIVVSALSLIFTVPAQAETDVPVSKADSELIEFIEDSGKRARVGLDERGRAWVLANTLMVPEPVGETGLYATTLKTSKALEAVTALGDSSIVPNFMVHLNEPIVVENAVNPSSVQGVNPVTKIAANEVHADGITGEGVAVAIIDTGIDPDHPYFKDAQSNSRIVAEACFVGIGMSTASATNNFPCLNNSTQQIGIGASDITNHVASGAPSNLANQFSSFNSTGTSQADWASIMDHGTHVAGLAAGSSNTLASIPDSAPGGIAPDADIISIRVFGWDAGWYWDTEYEYWYFSTGGAYYLDILAAVDWVTENQDTYNIAALNLSLGGGEYGVACDGDISNNFTAARNAGVAPLVATGNEYFSNAVAWPACASSAIAVGASTGDDQIALFSNSGVMLDIAAPGADVGSAVPRVNGDYSASAYERWDGTSMATPVAAGAVALMKANRSNLTVNQIEAALKNTGVLIDDVVVQNIPRINVDSAISSVGGILLQQTITASGSNTLNATQSTQISATATSAFAVSVVGENISEICSFTSSSQGSTLNVQVTGLGAGTCKLRFTQGGSSGYNSARRVFHEIEIVKLNQTISVGGPTSATITSSDIELTASASSGLNVAYSLYNSAGICTATSDVSSGVRTVELSFQATGVCTVRFTQTGSNAYQPANLVAREVTVSKSSQSILVSAPSTLTAGSSSAVTASVSSGTVSVASSTPSVCSFSNSTVNALTPGQCVLSFSVPENDTHAASNTTRTITISPTPIQVVRMLSPKATARSVTIRWNEPSNLGLSGFSNYSVKYRISYPGKKFSSWTTRTTNTRTFRISLNGAKYRLEYTVKAVAPDSTSRETRGKVKTF